MSDNGLVWETPTDTHDRRGGKWMPLLVTLQQRPGEWAVLYEQQPGESETQARNKKVQLSNLAGRHGVNLELASRLVDGRVKVYGRVLS